MINHELKKGKRRVFTSSRECLSDARKSFFFPLCKARLLNYSNNFQIIFYCGNCRGYFWINLKRQLTSLR